MTLGGLAIAIGELVDDAVVDVENIFRRLRENREAGNPRSVFDVVVSASQEVRSGIVYATMIIVLVFVPLFALSGIEGRLFAPLGEAYIISILASLVVSITLTPVMAYYMLPRLKRLRARRQRARPRARSAATRALLERRLRAIRRADDRRRAVAVVAAAVGGRAVCRAPSCRRSTRARSRSTCCSIPGISLAESNRVGLIAERLILEVPEVKAVGRRTGRAELDEHAEGVHSSEIEVDLKPGGAPKTEIVADLRARLAVLAVVDQRRPADLAPARPHAVGRARRRSRSRSSATTSTRCAAPAEALRAAAGAHPGPRRSSGREAGPHPAARNPRRLPARRRSTACSPPRWSTRSAGCRTDASSRASSMATAAST